MRGKLASKQLKTQTLNLSSFDYAAILEMLIFRLVTLGK